MGVQKAHMRSRVLCSRTMAHLTTEQTRFLASLRVAHLATAGPDSRPHVVPVCFAIADGRCYIAIDEKPKRAAPSRLKRLRNIAANPSVALVADRYDDDWSRLGYLLLEGRARVLEEGVEHTQALGLLRKRYVPYRSMALEQRPVIAIDIERAVSWGDLTVEA